MIIVHSGEPRTPEEQLRDEIEVLSAELYNAELRLANLQKSEQFRKKETPSRGGIACAFSLHWRMPVLI